MIEELAHHELVVTDEKTRNKQARATVHIWMLDCNHEIIKTICKHCVFAELAVKLRNNSTNIHSM